METPILKLLLNQEIGLVKLAAVTVQNINMA